MSVTSKQQRDAFAEQGYLAFGSLYDAAQVQRLRDALDEMADARYAKVPIGGNAEGDVVVSFDLSRSGGRTTPSFTRMFRVNDVFREHAFHPVVCRAATEILGVERLRFQEDQTIVKAPGVSGPLHWHQDHVYFPFDRTTQIACWVALDDVTERSGGVEFVVGSHLLGVKGKVDFETGTPLEDAGGDIPQDPESAGHTIARPMLSAGDCVFHHGLTWHASRPNTGDRPRRGLITRFFEDGTCLNRTQSPQHPVANVEGLVDGEPIQRDDEFPLVPLGL